jgi:hypothetical protein
MAFGDYGILSLTASFVGGNFIWWVFGQALNKMPTIKVGTSNKD